MRALLHCASQPRAALVLRLPLAMMSRPVGAEQTRQNRDGRGEPCEAMHGSGEEQGERQRVIQRESLGHGIDADVIHAVEDGGENVG